MSKKLAVIVVDDYYECLEVHYPRLRLIEAGLEVKIAGLERDHIYKSKEGYWAKSTHTFADIDPKEVSVLIIPGGWAPDRLRRWPDCLNLTKQAWNNGAILGYICHGAWVPISAQIVKGKRATCFHAIKDDLINAGAVHVPDQRCVVDGKMVTAQTPEDLPVFMAEIVKLLNM